jgi:hypothetical protein
MGARHGLAARHRTSSAACGLDLPPVILAPLVAVVVLVLLASRRHRPVARGHVLPLLMARAPPVRPA